MCRAPIQGTVAAPPSEHALQVLASGHLCPELIFVGFNSEIVEDSIIEARLLSLYYQAQRRSFKTK